MNDSSLLYQFPHIPLLHEYRKMMNKESTQNSIANRASE